MDYRLEVVVIPVSDVDRAHAFYKGLGWRLDADVVAGNDFRLVQVTPPGSPCYWFWGRPSVDDLWHDLRAASSEIRPDWDLSKSGLREAWDAGDRSRFHGWARQAREWGETHPAS